MMANLNYIKEYSIWLRYQYPNAVRIDLLLGEEARS
jgi:hypothetical protein